MILSLELQYNDGGRSVNTIAAIVIEMDGDKLKAVSIAFDAESGATFHSVNLDVVKTLILRDTGVLTWEWSIAS